MTTVIETHIRLSQNIGRANGRTFDGRIGRIDKTMLGYEDHGLLTFVLHLSLADGSGQGAGTTVLDGKPVVEGDPRSPHLACGAMIAAVLNVVGVSQWEDLPGKSVIALYYPGERDLIRGIASLDGQRLTTWKDVYELVEKAGES